MGARPALLAWIAGISVSDVVVARRPVIAIGRPPPTCFLRFPYVVRASQLESRPVLHWNHVLYYYTLIRSRHGAACPPQPYRVARSTTRHLYVEDPDFDPPLALDDTDRLIYIADDWAGDIFFFLPDDPPRFIEHPDGEYPSEQGTTFAEWIASLDPRERFYREATRTIRDGTLIESAGLPDDIPWLFPFVPAGHEIPRLHVGDDRGLDLDRIVRVLEEVAHQDHQVLFSMSLEREDQLEVRLPMFNALLRGASRSKGVAVYVPVNRQDEALSWLTAQFTQRGYPSPLSFRGCSGSSGCWRRARWIATP